AVRDIFAVDVDLPLLCRIIIKHLVQQRNMPSHLLLLGKLSDFLAFVFRGADVIREQTAAHSLEKVPRAPRASSHANVEGASLPAFEARNEFFRRSDATAGGSHI